MRLAVTILLALSLAANVFLGGFVAGRLLGGPGLHRPPLGAHGMGPPRPALIAAAESLSPEGREIFRKTFESEGAKLRADFGRSGELRRAFAEALAAEPFDRARSEAALAAMQAADAESHRAASLLFIEAAEKMTPADRAVLVEAYRNRHRKAWRERRRED